jgi:hypothetical protein
MTLQAGMAIEDISPLKPLPLVGYPHFERILTGINDPLLASALYLDNDSEALMMIAVDILFLDTKTICEIRKKIAVSTGLRECNILISCTHTHSGPATMPFAWITDVDADYMEFLKENVVKAGIRAAKAKKSAKLAVTSVNVSGVGCNRHDPEGPRDPEVAMIAIKDVETDKISGISTVYSMHPTVMHEDSTLVSSDFPGYTREYLRQEFGEDLTIMYHTAPEGNQSPRYHVKGQTFSEAKRLGYILGKAVADKIKTLTDEDFSDNVPLAVSGTKILVKRRTFPSVSDAEKNLEFRRNEFARLKAEDAGHGPIRTAECSVFGAESTLSLAKQSADGSLEKSFAANPDAEVQVMQIGDAYFVGMPGELFVEYALNLKSRSPEKTFVICLANGELQGYVVTEGAEGYEADNSTLLPETGDIIVDAAVGLINKIGGIKG